MRLNKLATPSAVSTPKASKKDGSTELRKWRRETVINTEVEKMDTSYNNHRGSHVSPVPRLSQGVSNDHAPAPCPGVGPPDASALGMLIKGKQEERCEDGECPIRSSWVHLTSYQLWVFFFSFLSLSSGIIISALLTSCFSCWLSFDRWGLSH